MVTSYIDGIYPKPHKLGRQRRQEFLFPPRIADLQNDVLALDVAQLIQTLSKGDEANSGLGCSEDNRPDSKHLPRRLLRLARERRGEDTNTESDREPDQPHAAPR